MGITWPDFESAQVSRFQVHVFIRYVIKDIMSRAKYPDLSPPAAHKEIIFRT